jgi:hypothetical protein
MQPDRVSAPAFYLDQQHNGAAPDQAVYHRRDTASGSAAETGLAPVGQTGRLIRVINWLAAPESAGCTRQAGYRS